MISKVYSAALAGIDSFRVTIEVDSFPSMETSFQLVGLPDAVVKESKDRIRSACFNSGFPFPDTSLVINLAPADRRKEGSAFDVPLLLAILRCNGVVFQGVSFEGKCFTGELSLTGDVRPVRGVLYRVLRSRRKRARGGGCRGNDGIFRPPYPRYSRSPQRQAQNDARRARYPLV